MTGPVDRRRMGDAHQVEDRRGEVRGVLVLVAQSTRRQARGPAQQQRHADASGEGLSLVEAERGVGRHSPAFRIMRHRPRPPDERGIPVDVRGPVLRQPRHMGEATEIGAGALRTTFRGTAVVGGEDDEGVVILPQLIEKIDDSRQGLVNGIDHCGVDLLVPRVEILRLPVQRVPVDDLLPQPSDCLGQRRLRRDDAQVDLPGVAFTQQHIPPLRVPARYFARSDSFAPNGPCMAVCAK